MPAHAAFVLSFFASSREKKEKGETVHAKARRREEGGKGRDIPAFAGDDIMKGM
jgi:hypothetical protein